MPLLLGAFTILVFSVRDQAVAGLGTGVDLNKTRLEGSFRNGEIGSVQFSIYSTLYASLSRLGTLLPGQSLSEISPLASACHVVMEVRIVFNREYCISVSNTRMHDHGA